MTGDCREWVRFGVIGRAQPRNLRVYYPSTENTFGFVTIHARRYLENSIEITTKSSNIWNARKKSSFL